MKVATPMVSWHAREPVLSVDIHPSGKIATAGADNFVRIWELGREKDANDPKPRVLTNLSYHNASVNIVRFSPDGKLLASAGDDHMIFIYKQADKPDVSSFGKERQENIEDWVRTKALRGHLGDVYSLCWSPDSTQLFTGSVDNKSIVWDLTKGEVLQYFKEHTGYVQGVAWDPLGQMLNELLIYPMQSNLRRTCRAYTLRQIKRGKKSSKKFKLSA
eukprot:247394-Amorphochlora_amoeboformis.AAC.1